MSVTDKDMGWQQIKRELTIFGQLEVWVGFQGGTAGEIVQIATFHEFGTVNIPARPFLSSAMVVGQDAIGKAIEAAIDSIIRLTSTAIDAAKKLGILAVSLVKKRILASPEWAAPLSAKTIRAKKSSKPLVDTAQMLNSVTFVVKRGGTVVAQG